MQLPAAPATMARMRVLVTGGAGFIGSHYVRSVLTGAWGGPVPEQVVVLDKFTYAGNIANLAPVRGRHACASSRATSSTDGSWTR